MGLGRYHQKRDFSRTQEPRGKVERAAGRSFVVQKHEASHLHYDFRLEHDGVLLSWAVPKGPTADPAVKRLAMQVEDHPVDYGDFEGTIPQGQYGGGTVMVWDRGTWEPHHDVDAMIRKGHISFDLHGSRLKGGWHLIRTAADPQGRARWLLSKIDDAAANPGYELTETFKTSAKTRRTMAAIAKGTDVWRSNRAEPTEEPKRTAKKRAPKERAAATVPATLAPELCTLVDAAPEGDEWLHEVKLDGYRVLAHLDEGVVTLRTRRGHDWTDRFPTVARELARLPVKHAVLDGELVAPGERGTGDFQELQNSLEAGRDGGLVYFAFDLPFREGDLRKSPLSERKAALHALLGERKLPHVLESPSVEGHGSQVLRRACQRHLEGIVSKRLDSPYVSGRGRDWVKSKCLGRQEFVIVGYTRPKGARSHLGALLVGERVEGELRYAGKVGTGFSDASLDALAKQLKPLARADAPVPDVPRAVARGVIWVEPKLVCEIQFTERTREGLIRHPSFQGLREDKTAKETHREEAKPVTKPEQPSADAVVITHPDRVLYKDVGVTKADVVAYYEAVAERMLPHAGHRPLTLVRCPSGAGDKCFFQKHASHELGPGLVPVPVKEDGKTVEYIALGGADGLRSLVQMNALELHTWGSHVKSVERPDLLVLDLDPDPSVAWARVVEAAREVRELLREASLESFVKTTGGKGLHVCVPLTPKLDWDTTKTLAHGLANALVTRAPDRYLATMSKAKRKGKIFVDYLRNGRGATFVAPYSTRARPGATVAMPLRWEELTPTLDPRDFTVRTVPKLVARRRDPWADLLGTKQTVPAAVLRAITRDSAA